MTNRAGMDKALMIRRACPFTTKNKGSPRGTKLVSACLSSPERVKCSGRRVRLWAARARIRGRHGEARTVDLDSLSFDGEYRNVQGLSRLFLNCIRHA